MHAEDTRDPLGRPVTGDVAPEVMLLAALAEVQPVPTIYYGTDGRIMAYGSAARRVVGADPQRGSVIRADDGTDLWTIIAARADEAAPVFDVKVPLRTADGVVLDVTLMVAPLRARRGHLGGALAIIVGGNLEFDRPPESRGVRGAGLAGALGHIGQLTGADTVYVARAGLDAGFEAQVLSVWRRTPSEKTFTRFELRGTPAAALAARDVVSMPDIRPGAYPDDPWSAETPYRAFVGVGLTDAGGRRLGILGGLWREPLAATPAVSAAFRVLGAEIAPAIALTEAQRELKESEQRYSAVFEGSAVPILLVDPDTTQVVDASPAAVRFYGYPRDELITMSMLQLDTLPLDVVQAELARALQGSRGYFVARHRLADGALRDVEVDAGPIVVGGRRLLYAMVRDITDRKRIEAALEASKRELERTVVQRTEDLLRANAELHHAATTRDMIFATLTQEMRTSLQTITGFTGLMLEGMAGDLTEEQRRQIEMVAEAGKRLTAFVSSLIEAQRSEVGLEQMAVEEFDIVDLAESVVFGLTSFAEAKGLEAMFRARERPILIKSDRYKLQQILLNLLSNAVRFTRHGVVSIAVAREGDGVAVSVADTGEGIAPERLASLYDSPEADRPSTGIGLPTSRRLAEALGGRIEASSEVGQGSVFRLCLPAAPPAGMSDPGAGTTERDDDMPEEATTDGA